MEVVPKWEDWLSSNSQSKETQYLTSALQSSLSANIHSPPAVSTTTSAALSNHNPRRGHGNCRDVLPGPQKMGKWKSRAVNKKKSTKMMTTYLQVDPENFRAMVQLMTGPPPAAHVIRPEPKKLFLLTDRAGIGGGFSSVGAVEKETELDVDSFFNFPTLESCGI